MPPQQQQQQQQQLGPVLDLTAIAAGKKEVLICGDTNAWSTLCPTNENGQKYRLPSDARTVVINKYINFFDGSVKKVTLKRVRF